VINQIISGACYWPKAQNGDGHSLLIPNGTYFEVPLEGPLSRICVKGVCKEGYFEILDGDFARKKFDTANKAVCAVRPIPSGSNNAFLYVRFFINGEAIPADVLRHRSEYRCDETEEQALNMIVDRNKRLSKELGIVELRKMAARKIIENPELLEIARPLSIF